MKMGTGYNSITARELDSIAIGMEVATERISI
jgi:hypothetical protein